MENCSMSDYENLLESPDFKKYHEKLCDYQDELCEEKNVEILAKLFIYDGKHTQYFVCNKNWKLAIIR